MKKKVLKALYWLTVVILCLVIFAVVFRHRICEQLTNRGISLYEAGKYNSAERYFKTVLTVYPNSDKCNLYLLLTEMAQGERPSPRRIRDLLVERDNEVMMKGLDLVNDEAIQELQNGLEKLAKSDDPKIREAAAESLLSMKSIALKMRCKACGARYVAKIPEKRMPYTCKKCGKNTVYPADRFSLRKLFCNSCGYVYIVEAMPGEPLPNNCPRCKRHQVGQIYRCRNCRHLWGAKGATFSCPKCSYQKVGSISVTPSEAARFRQSH